MKSSNDQNSRRLIALFGLTALLCQHSATAANQGGTTNVTETPPAAAESTNKVEKSTNSAPTEVAKTETAAKPAETSPEAGAASAASATNAPATVADAPAKGAHGKSASTNEIQLSFQSANIDVIAQW